jgi:hypothetical protein
MGQSIRFPSLGNPEAAYLLHSSLFAYDFGSHDAHDRIAPWAGVYQTYEDRLVQHSPDCCAPVEDMGDDLVSLTTFCLDPENGEALEIAASHWKSLDLYNEATKRSTILKASRIRHKEGKPRYIKIRDLTVSSSEGKRFDRRWQEIVPWMDGSVDSTFGLVTMGQGRSYGLERYVVLNRIIQALCDEDGTVHGAPEDHFKGFKGQHLDRAFGAFESLMVAHQNRKLVEPLLEMYDQDVARSMTRNKTAG